MATRPAAVFCLAQVLACSGESVVGIQHRPPGRGEVEVVGGPCDGTGTCNQCLDCVAASQCNTERSLCDNNPDCRALLDCLDACTNDACAETCRKNQPGGLYYSDLEACQECACMNDCGHVAKCLDL